MPESVYDIVPILIPSTVVFIFQFSLPTKLKFQWNDSYRGGAGK